MGPRGFTLPSAKTESAKAARNAFFCELCQKGYSRMNEFEAHESSYDHQHKKRLKDMREMQRQVQSAGRKEEKGPLMSIKLGSSSSKLKVSGGFKKGGFKNAFGSLDDQAEGFKQEEQGLEEPLSRKPVSSDIPDEKDDSDVTDQDDYYDPKKPTGCTPTCAGKMS